MLLKKAKILIRKEPYMLLNVVYGGKKCNNNKIKTNKKKKYEESALKLF